MEKTNLDNRRPQKMSWYEDPRSVGKQNADYLKKLSSLRESLFDQEQTNLAHAIERLRAKQNRDALSNRQKNRQVYENAEANDKKFITTLEKFRQSRPKKYRPELHPLEGKQLIEPQTSRSGDKHDQPRSADENVIKNNLQRLTAPITPTSSIPNIGRKSQKSTQQLVLETSSFHRKKSCLSADNSDKNPFKHVRKGARSHRVIRPADLDELELSPQAVKCEKLGDHDKLNMDKLKEYYCIYYLPSNTPTNQDEVQSEDGETVASTVSYTEKPRENNEFEQDRFGNKFPNEYYRYKPGYFGASQRVPERKPMIHPITGKALITNMEDIRQQRLKRLHLSESINTIEPDSHEEVIDRVDVNSQKKKIIVDMPAIVFNAPTPDVSDVELRATLLAKAYKQNELRKRELKNLMDDVKELNKRSDDLAGQISVQRPLA